MDFVYCDGSPLFIPGNSNYAAYDMPLTRGANKSGSFTFSLPPGHPATGKINLMKSEIAIYRDDRTLWKGRPISSTEDIYGGRIYVCEGRLGYLNDSYHKPSVFEGTAKEYLEKLLTVHNSQTYTDLHKQILPGEVDVEGTLKVEQTKPQSTWELLDSHLISNFGGYIQLRDTGSATYLDYKKTSGQRCSQVIELGVNLLDLEEYVDAADVYSVMVPLGKLNEETGEYVGIESAEENGLYYIKNDAAVDYYGRIVRVVMFDEIEDPVQLLEAAKNELLTALSVATTISANAIDLTEAGIDTDAFSEGDSIRIYSPRHGLDTYFICNEINEYIGEPGTASYTLGAGYVTLTAQQVATGQRLTNTGNASTVGLESLNQIVSSLPTTQSGSVTQVIPASGTATIAVAYKKAFSDKPVLLLMPQRSGFEYEITSESAEGFTFTVSGTAAAVAVFSWTATL